MLATTIWPTRFACGPLAHLFEAKAFNLVSSGYMDKAMFEFLAALHPDAAANPGRQPTKRFLATNPSGETIGEESRDEEGVLYVDIDVSACVRPKQFHDISGGYNRFDIFHLTVDRTAHRPVSFVVNERGLPGTSNAGSSKENREIDDEGSV